MSDPPPELDGGTREPMALRQVLALSLLALERARDDHLCDYATAQAALSVLHEMVEAEREKEQIDTRYYRGTLEMQ